MSKQIIWSPLSVNDFEEVLNYLDNEWTEKVANRFIDLTEEFIHQISINPKQFPLIHKRKKIRKCVITKHNSLYYRELKTKIDILRIYDTRKDPKSLKFK